jgi:transposase
MKPSLIGSGRDAINRGQSETGALACRPGREEWLEDLNGDVGAHAGSCVNRAGCAWHLLPHDFPPYRTVYDYYARWEKDGTTQAIHDLLRGRVREQAGRAGAGSDRIHHHDREVPNPSHARHGRRL